MKSVLSRSLRSDRLTKTRDNVEEDLIGEEFVP